MTALPIHAVLPELLAALRVSPNAVLVAPPGAGKTTAIAPALLDQPWCTGQILLLSPRRLAARAAAERMAQMAGEAVGKTIGYATRMDSRQSAETRVLELTEGIFVNRIQADPELSGVSAVLFDEVHERNLDSDFGLALAIDTQGGLRDDLRLLAMSATLDGARFAALMGDCPVIESEGRSHPLIHRYLGRRSEARIEDEMTAAIRRALADEAGGVLAFLPGVAEIERTAERLANLPPDVDLHRLHGTLEPAEQRTAIAAAPLGRRKLVLATSIAETSLTLDGVRVVVDSGLARRPRYDRAAGMTRLVTERASQAAVTQRAGRAARQSPGVAYRLWEEAATAGLPRFDPPEILEADLSPLLLSCALWGLNDPRSLNWIDAPPEAAISEARRRLETLGALDGAGRPTAHGAAIAKLPLPPRLAHMLLEAQARGWGRLAAEAAVLVSERGLGGQDADLETRLRRWKTERGKRAEAGRKLAERWFRLTPKPSPLQGRGLGEGESPIASESGGRGNIPLSPEGERGLGTCIALAFPDRLSKRRGQDGADWISVGGRGFRLDPTSSLAREEWLAVAEIQGAASGVRILSAAPVDFATIEDLFGDRIESGTHVQFDPATGGVRAMQGRRLGAIQLSKGQDAKADPVAIAAALVEGVRTHGVALLPWSEAAQHLRERTAFARRSELDLPDLSDDALTATLDDWLPAIVPGKRRLSDVDRSALSGVLDALLGWDGRKRVDALTPVQFVSPAGSHHDIDYTAEAGPTVTIRVQALFGLATHPAIAGGRVPLVLSLTSPAGRPIQTTKDLPGFWSGSWVAVAKEMRGRYPKHPWPDDPAAASATLRTKKADARS